MVRQQRIIPTHSHSGEKGNWNGWISSLCSNSLNEKKLRAEKLKTSLGEEAGRGCSPVPSDRPSSSESSRQRVHSSKLSDQTAVTQGNVFGKLCHQHFCLLFMVSFFFFSFPPFFFFFLVEFLYLCYSKKMWKSRF